MPTPSNLPPAKLAEPLELDTTPRPHAWVHVATIGGHAVLIDTNMDARALLDLLDNAELYGDLVASHKFCREVLEPHQYEHVKRARLTGEQWSLVGASIVSALTGDTQLPAATPEQVTALEVLRHLAPGDLGGPVPDPSPAAEPDASPPTSNDSTDDEALEAPVAR